MEAGTSAGGSVLTDSIAPPTDNPAGHAAVTLPEELARYVAFRKMLLKVGEPGGEDLSQCSLEEVEEHRRHARDQQERAERGIWARTPWAHALAGLAANLRQAIDGKHEATVNKYMSLITAMQVRLPTNFAARLEEPIRRSDHASVATIAHELGSQQLESELLESEHPACRALAPDTAPKHGASRRVRDAEAVERSLLDVWGDNHHAIGLSDQRLGRMVNKPKSTVRGAIKRLLQSSDNEARGYAEVHEQARRARKQHPEALGVSQDSVRLAGTRLRSDTDRRNT